MNFIFTAPMSRLGKEVRRMVAYYSSYLSATVCVCGFSFQDLNHICKIKMVCVVSASRLEEELLRMISYECCLVKKKMLFLGLMHGQLLSTHP